MKLELLLLNREYHSPMLQTRECKEETNTCKRASCLKQNKKTHNTQTQKLFFTKYQGSIRNVINAISSLNLHYSLELFSTLGFLVKKRKEHGFEMSWRLSALFISVCF